MKDIKDFDKWVEQVRIEWKHIPSLKGKQTKKHLFILRTLTIRDMSCWDLAKAYLEETEPSWSQWIPDTQYHKRQNQNSKMNKRLNFLENKKYVHKIGSLYRLTAKGFFLMLALDPTIIASMSRTRLNESFGSDYIPEEHENFVIGHGKLFAHNGQILTEHEFENLKTILYPLFQDPLQRKVLSYAVKQALISWKVNLDEMTDEEFMRTVVLNMKRKIEKLQKRGKVHV